MYSCYMEVVFNLVAYHPSCAGFYNPTYSFIFNFTIENCVHCLPNGQLRPNTTEFLLFLEHFFTANPTTSCAAAGHAAYNSAVVVDYNSDFMKTKIESKLIYLSACPSIRPNSFLSY